MWYINILFIPIKNILTEHLHITNITIKMVLSISQRKDRVSALLEKHGYSHPSSRPISLVPHKEKPTYIEEERIKFERNQIIKKHIVLKNKQNKAYTNFYLNSVSDLLFNTPKEYSRKRNELSIKTSKDFFLPQMEDKCTKSNFNTLNSSQEPAKILYYPTDVIKPAKKGSKCDRLVDIMHTSNKVSNVYCKNFKKLLLRRIDNVKKINVINLTRSNTCNINNEQANANGQSRRSFSQMIGKKQDVVNKFGNSIKQTKPKKKLKLKTTMSVTVNNNNNDIKQVRRMMTTVNERYMQ